VLTDPADVGPVVLALPQDVQVEEFDFPAAMFEPRLNRIPRPRPDLDALAEAAATLRESRRPLLVIGGGARYSGAGAVLIAFAQAHGVPMVETPAGRTLVPHDHPLHAGPLGIIGSSSANAIAAQADVVLAVGTRLQDFTTASWTVFADGVRVVAVNAARFDAVKHASHPVVGDAREAIRELDAALSGWSVDPQWTSIAGRERAGWDAAVDSLRAGTAPDGALSYAQMVGVVNDASGPDDYVLTSSGGMPGELVGGWRTGPPAGPGQPGPTSGATMDMEYGFSCMGYELAGSWGASIARARTHPAGVVTTMLGDGSYLMLNSELFSAAFAGHPFVAVVCDNGGYAVIHRLQTSQGADGFNNLYADCEGPGAKQGGVRVDFAAHAAALGCVVEDVPEGSPIEAVRAAYGRAKAASGRERRPAVVLVRTHPNTWTESGAWWEVGVPASLSGRAGYEQGKAHQQRWLS
jgi:3D-(3,5/4)-trihydroxycyclohexane-1,2-dione acylhydrolase (decyclizing)